MSTNKRLFLLEKRFFDVTAALLGGIILFIPVYFLMLLIRWDSPGPAIFKQLRVGKDGKEFVMYKLRSMYVDAEKNGPQLAEENDQRCTRLGIFMRRYHLDELPQLWNILKGDMSFVGPRPERAYFYEQISKTLPQFRERLAVKPGLTGWAQTQESYHVSAERKLELDQCYMMNMGWSMDLDCLLLTILKIARRDKI